MKAESGELREIIKGHGEKLRSWYETLREIMPGYFFKSFGPERLDAILPLLFNLDGSGGIQRISCPDSVILVYLKDDENNLLTTSRMMSAHNISGAVIHESTSKLMVGGCPRTLVVEAYSIRREGAAGMSCEPLCTRKEFSAACAKHKIPARVSGEIHKRINWEAVSDLGVEKLAGRMPGIVKAQSCDYPVVEAEKCGDGELRISFIRSCSPPKGIYHRIISVLSQMGFHINRAYARQVTRSSGVEDFSHLPVTVTTLYVDGRGLDVDGARVRELLWQMTHVTWCDMLDNLHCELSGNNWLPSEVNLMRAAAAFAHSQLAFVDANAYSLKEIWRYMGLYEELLGELAAFFRMRTRNSGAARVGTALKRLERRIGAVNTGLRGKDEAVKTVFRALLNFFTCILKTNYYSGHKSCLAFRLDPAFMDHYAGVSDSYAKAFPQDRPYGVFFFFRHNCVSFHVRFAPVARGGWRSVMFRNAGHNDSYEFASDELFREVFVLAHTQHLKNKDIYEGGAKMISLLELPSGDSDFRPDLYQAQRSTCAALLQLINYDDTAKRLRDTEVTDLYGAKEIIELGPDENMHDVMIGWIGAYAEKEGYALGSGLISGKSDKGINHKHYGVTSFGVHQYLLKVLEELEIDPEHDDFSVKMSGGPSGDVAGNELKLLLSRKPDGDWSYPRLRIVAVNDGPAAAWDPDGLDREELLRLVSESLGLDKFDPEKLRGEGAAIIYMKAEMGSDGERNLLVHRSKGAIQHKRVSRDEAMTRFQENLLCRTDVFIPCGGRPATIDADNVKAYIPGGKASMRAVVEGANSFITPAARDILQDAGVWVIKDASANKCGVITSSYEIISGLMLNAEEFQEIKEELVVSIMENLRRSARLEADWLFAQYHAAPGNKLTALTERLSRRINSLNLAVKDFLDTHPQYVLDQTILEHLPAVFMQKYPDRVSRIPEEYRKAIVAVELATRIVYYQSGDLEGQIQAVQNRKPMA